MRLRSAIISQPSPPPHTLKQTENIHDVTKENCTNIVDFALTSFFELKNHIPYVKIMGDNH